MMLSRSVIQLNNTILSTIKRNFSNELNTELLYQKYYKKNDLIQGYCTEKGSEIFRNRNKKLNKDYWKTPYYINETLHLSGLGLGTQNGEPNQQTDIKQMEVIIKCLQSGYVNTVDTDINFRYGKSEKTINAALNYLIQESNFSREQFFIATKLGYLMSDVDSQLDDKGFKDIIIQQGIVQKQQIVNDIYCLSKNFIHFCLQKSRISLGLQTIDLLYLNNPIQALLSTLGKKQMYSRLQKAFQTLEQIRQSKKIRYYGLTSFISLRSPPSQSGVHGSLSEIMEIARKVGGQNHGLRFTLIPFNLGMPQAILDWQKSNKDDTQKSVFEIAKQNQLNVNLCCPLFQGRVAKIPFQSKKLDNIKANTAKHLQLVRSLNHINLMISYFGTLSAQHALQNLQVAENRPLTPQQWNQILPIPKNK